MCDVVLDALRGDYLAANDNDNDHAADEYLFLSLKCKNLHFNTREISNVYIITSRLAHTHTLWNFRGVKTKHINTRTHFSDTCRVTQKCNVKTSVAEDLIEHVVSCCKQKIQNNSQKVSRFISFCIAKYNFIQCYWNKFIHML